MAVPKYQTGDVWKETFGENFNLYEIEATSSVPDRHGVFMYLVKMTDFYGLTKPVACYCGDFDRYTFIKLS